MAKVMLFIDGTWLYANNLNLAQSYGNTDYRLDFGRLPRVLAEEVGKRLGATEVDVVRTYLFGSYALNHDLQDDDAVQRRLEFFSMLKEEYHYEVETFPINYRGRRLRKADRDPMDTFEPKEKCVDISLATSMLYFAAIPSAYDIAIAVLGDQDFKPALQHVRRLGKRVAIVSIKASCAPEFSDPADEARVKDFDIIWLDDFLEHLELKYVPHQLQCESPTHKGDRVVWTTFYPRKGQRFYCDECRAEFASQKQEAQRDFVATNIELAMTPDAVATTSPGQFLAGSVKKKVADRGFGFVAGEDGRDYFFHLTDLEPGLDFSDVAEGLPVEFNIKKVASQDKAGAAGQVRRRTAQASAFEAG